jgi:4'-phosphopantetheinyl transferase EntD
MKAVEEAERLASTLALSVQENLRGRLSKYSFRMSAIGPDHGQFERLYDAEQEAVRRAVPKRRREFLAGRKLARACLEDLGLPSCAIPMDVHRAPIWPKGVVGSISHSNHLCAALVAPDTVLSAVGIDVEEAPVLKADLHELVLTPKERSWLSALPEGRHGPLGRLFFSVKESVYKCQFPLTNHVLEFHDVEVELGVGETGFRAEAQAIGRTFVGEIFQEENAVLTVARFE